MDNEFHIIRQIRDAMSSINYKIAILVVLAILAIGSNAIRTVTNVWGDNRQKRIEYLDAKVERLEAELDSCKSGTTVPFNGVFES